MKIQTFIIPVVFAAAPLCAAETLAPTTGAEPPATASAGSVARASFTREVVNREPTDPVSTLTNDYDRVYYFTEIRGMADASVIHRWEYDGKVMAEIPFNIGGPRWRVYSSKTLDPQWLGEWKASTVDADGTALSVNTFTYMRPDAPAPETQSTPAGE